MVSKHLEMPLASLAVLVMWRGQIKDLGAIGRNSFVLQFGQRHFDCFMTILYNGMK